MKPLHWILAVDLDGVILDFDLDYWFKHRGYFGKVKKGCVEALKKFRKMGYKIIVYTARIDGDRLRSEADILQALKEIAKVLQDNKVPYDEIWYKRGKPHADYYIDDCAIKFHNWEQVMRDITKDMKGEDNE